jgi:predicted ArsR family transcriptional regulator
VRGDRPSAHRADVDARLSRVACLGEPIRRDLYRYVATQPEPVSREQAAAGVNVPHHVAKFHLDRLEEDGLLQSEYRRPEGRTGPGAGRPAKLYRRADHDIEVSLPERRYDLAGAIMAEAISAAAASGAPISDTLRAAAQAAGRQLASDLTQVGSASVMPAVCAALEANGYEPALQDGRITLGNCPFHSLVHDYPQLVCGMNLDLISGLLDAFGGTALRADLEPGAPRCCVTITAAEPASR